MYIRNLIFTVLLILSSQSVLAAPKAKVVLVSHGGMGNPFWTVVFNGARQAAKDMDVQLQILWPNQDGDQSGTTQKLSEAISTRPDAIAVTLATSAHCPYIKEARQAGIPVIIYNARSREAGPDCPYQAYVGMDEYLAGKVSAQRALDLGLIKQGRVMVGLTEAGHAGLQDRAKGVTEVMKKRGIAVDVLDLSNDPAKVPLRVSGYYRKHQKDLVGMFIPSPNGIHPILTMKSDDPQGIGRVYASAFDLTPLIIQGIEKGQIDHTIDQQPYLQGYYSVMQLAMAVKGSFTPIHMNTGVGVVEKSNASKVMALVKSKVR